MNTFNSKPKFFNDYLDNGEIIDKLSDEEAGKLWKALHHYANNDQIDDFSGNRVVELTFYSLKKGIDRDFEKYNEKCNKNRKNAQKGGAPKGNQNAKKECDIPESEKDAENNNLSDAEYTQQQKQRLLSTINP